MGNKLIPGIIGESEMSAPKMVQPVVWLDKHTADVIQALIGALARQNPSVQAVILFGSIARHDERPANDLEPSDVDLLVLVDPSSGRTYLSREDMEAVYNTMGQVVYTSSDTPHEIQLTLAKWDLADWDVTFVESVARDGILLWARGPLPQVLAPVATRSVGASRVE